MVPTAPEVWMGAPVPSRLDEGWLVCLGRAHAVQDGAVSCPVDGQRVAVETCLLCHHLETLAGERDDASCAVSDAVTPYPRPR